MEVIALWPGPLFKFLSRSNGGGRTTQNRLGVSKAENNMVDWKKAVGLNSFLLFFSFFDNLTSSLPSDFHPGKRYNKTHHLIGLAATR